MTDRVKIRYEITLDRIEPPGRVAGATVRSITSADRASLAELMLDAYVGTIDYQGETLAQARDEVDAWFDEHAPLLDHSYCAVLDGVMASAVLVSAVRSTPFIAYVMSRARYKKRGLARLVTGAALDSARKGGYEHVVLFITEGNTASEALFAGLGARALDVVELPRADR